MKKVIIRAYQKSLLRPLFFPLQNDLPGKKFVFIVGCYNSGTSVLSHILASHPEISSLPSEGAVLTSGLTRSEDYGWPRMWHMCEDKVREDENSTVPDARRIKKDWSFWYDNNKDICLEKSITNSAKIRWFEKHFNSPYFIWIIRNGYCVAEGIRRRSKEVEKYDFSYKGTGYPIGMCARQWVVNNSVIETDTANVKKLFKITYEELMDDMDSVAGRIFEWLPVKEKGFSVDGVNQFSFHKETRPIKDMNKESFARLEDDDIKEINREARDSLKRWGYEVL